MAEDDRLKNNAGRVEHEALIDKVLADWSASVSSADALHQLEDASVPAGPINSVADVMDDPHFKARGSFEPIEVNGQARVVPAMHPKLDGTPGGTEWAGPKLGEHTLSVLKQWLNADAESISDWQRASVIEIA